MSEVAADQADWTPVEVDTELARLYGEIDRVGVRLDQVDTELDRVYGFGVNKGQLVYPEGSRMRTEKETWRAELLAALRVLRANTIPGETQYQVRRWRRYFLVNNTTGHVHRDMACTTCFPTTRYIWLVELADQPIDEMIAEWGEMACTVCFPDAPTNPAYHRPSRRDREARDAREAEKVRRAAVKAEKNLRPDEQFKDYHGWTVTTVAAAKQAIRDGVDLANYGSVGHRHPWAVAAETAAARAVEVLLARGVPQTELDRIAANARKRIGR